MKKLFNLILFLTLSVCGFAADASWKVHPIFDEKVSHIVETPGYVYFTSMNMEENPTNDIYSSLFRYDKKGDELMPLSASNILNGNNVRNMIYNPGKGYLAVLYHDYNIDLLNNDGTVANIPVYEKTNLSYSKEVNSMAVDAGKDRLYMATDFGYVAINDKKLEIAESRIYGKPLQAFCRLGDYYLAIQEDELLKAPVASPRLSLSDYQKVVEFSDPAFLYPLSETVCLLVTGKQDNRYVKKLSLEGDEIKIADQINGYFHNITNTANGVVFATATHLHKFDAEGNLTSIERPENYRNCAAVSDNFIEVWSAEKRKGLCSIKLSGDQWNLTRNWMLPNAPSTFVSTSFANHPDQGLLVLNYGYTPVTFSLYNFSPLLLSSYKQGRWQNLAPAYTNPDRTSLLVSPNGIVVDPDNNNYVYITSYHNGFARLNLKNPLDIIHISYANDGDNNNSGYVVQDPNPSTMSGYWNTTAPFFDNSGNLWIGFVNWDKQDDPKPYYWCWPASDRKATTTADNIVMPKVVAFDYTTPVANSIMSIPLSKTGKGMLVYANFDGTTRMALLNYNGTPSDPDDDTVYPMTEFYDSDGNALSLGRIRYLWEDPSTGYVWICHSEGVCYFVPSQVVNGNYQFYRVKVARNDGTNLADYLLDSVEVNQITTDGDGRKWFSTSGGGVVCTTSDGREILEEFTKANSMLPSDIVYGIGYDKASNSLMISTEKGYVEYFLPSVTTQTGKADVKAYPNPVRPEYSGYVTITDIPQGSLVKITDVAGNLVKDLGIMSGFEMLWDISDSNFNRVRSGVYHIMVSPANENSSYKGVGKILVVS